MDISLLIFLVLVLVIAGVVMVFLIGRGRSAAGLNKEKYRSAWLKIEQQLSPNNEASIHLAVLNADKLLDQALRERGFSGQTMGDRMKRAQSSWSNANTVWAAHKLRNRIAHESEVLVDHKTARSALDAFKNGLKDLGAI